MTAGDQAEKSDTAPAHSGPSRHLIGAAAVVLTEESGETGNASAGARLLAGLRLKMP